MRLARCHLARCVQAGAPALCHCGWSRIEFSLTKGERPCCISHTVRDHPFVHHPQDAIADTSRSCVHPLHRGQWPLCLSAMIISHTDAGPSMLAATI